MPPKLQHEYPPMLYDLMIRPDQDAVRIWLRERGLVAVERSLMENVVALSSSVDLDLVYDAASDRYKFRTVR